MRWFNIFIIFNILLFSLIAERLHAAEYVAFSLKIAQERMLATPKGKDYRNLHPEVFTMGGITAVRGLVYDRKTEDIILVGERDPGRAILTLDDFVVALKARFIHGKWPLVSIDPTPDTKKNQMQLVRFEGGIEETQFGEDLFDADYRLKKIGMGLLPSGISGFETYWDLGKNSIKNSISGSYKINSRFWFYPVLPSVSVREDVVSIKGLKVGVFTEVMSAEIDGKKIDDLSTFQHIEGDKFAKEVSEKFDELAIVHPSFSRVQGLDELVALTKAIEEMDKRPDLSFWLTEYRVKEVKTKKKIQVLKRKEEYEVTKARMVYSIYREVSGGVKLMAIALRLKAGDVTALREAVLITRFRSDQLVWSFKVNDWGGDIEMSSGFAELLAHGYVLLQKKRYEWAIDIFNKLIKLNPENIEAWRGKGQALLMSKKYREAMVCVDGALKIRPKDPYALIAKGVLLDDMGAHIEAIKYYDIALSVLPMFAEALGGKGIALFRLGIALGDKAKQRKGLEYIEEALKIYPNSSEFLMLKSWLLYEMQSYRLALQSAEEAIQINPYLTGAWFLKAECLVILGKEEEALTPYKRFVELSQTGASALPNPLWSKMIEQMLPK